jgi:hypothetical protein
MHNYLKKTIDRLVDHFICDRRCIGVLLHGSGGQGTDDIYSDIDLSVVVEEKDYIGVRDGLEALCSSICGDIRLWYPEGEQENCVNYAFLFETADGQFLCDLAIFALPAYSTKPYDKTEKVLFERDNILTMIREGQPRLGIRPDAIPGIIEVYWLYAYLNGKYFQRGDLYRAIYILQTLFNHHMNLLGALHPGTDWCWWPKDLGKLTVDHQQDMLSYLQCMSLEDIPIIMKIVLQRFSKDANEICHREGLHYPEELETYVRKHLREMSILTE